MKQPFPPSPRGFTLIELLTVIAIIGILAAILIPVVGRVRESARGATCRANLRTLGQGAYLHAQDHQDLLPPLGGAAVPDHLPSDWLHALAPYVIGTSANQIPTLEESRGNTSFFCPQALAVYGNSLPPGETQTYGYNRFVTSHHGSFPYQRRSVSESFHPSQTMLFADGNWRGETGFDLRVDTGLLPTPSHSGGENYNLVYLDGHVSFLTLAETSIDPENVLWDRRPLVTTPRR